MIYLFGGLFGLTLIFAVVAALILPWVNLRRITRLERQLYELGLELRRLRGGAEEKAAVVPPVSAPAPVVTPVPVAPAPVVKPVAAAAVPKPVKAAVSFEQRFGARLPVWIGAVALALSGFYFIKYSVEQGWLSPLVRVLLGVLAGGGLVFAAHLIHRRGGVSNGPRIAQALSGAGIAVLYICFYAATALYGLLPAVVGFAAMAGVTGMAVVLSVRHGAPVALLGLLGGFLTPALIESSSPSAGLLFPYLFAVVFGLLVVGLRQGWAWLAILAVLGGYGWALLWLLTIPFNTVDGLVIGLFLLGVCGLVLKSMGQLVRDIAAPVPAANIGGRHISLPLLALAGATGLLFLLAARADFSLMSFGLYGLLAAGGIAMAWFRAQAYRFLPWLSLGVSAVMLLAWRGFETSEYAAVLLGFAGLHAGAGLFLSRRSGHAALWAGVAALASIVYFLVGYAGLHQPFENGVVAEPWALISFALAAGWVVLTARLARDVPADDTTRTALLSMYAGAATAFVSLGFALALDKSFLAIAVAGQIFALAWIAQRTGFAALRRYIAVLAALFAVLLLPQIFLLCLLAVHALTDMARIGATRVPLVDMPLLHLGVPAAFLLCASVALRRGAAGGDTKLVKGLEGGAIALFGLAFYYLFRGWLHPDMNLLAVKAGFSERGAVTLAILLYGAACWWLGRRFGRGAFVGAGVLLAVMAFFRTAYFDLLLANPLWHADQIVRGYPLFNALLLNYGVPALALLLALRHDFGCIAEKWRRPAKLFALFLLFTLVTLQVRHLYHGPVLTYAKATGAEIYTYSFVWLLFGIGVLFAGTLRKDKVLRIASLAVMMLVAGKVFLYDAAALKGLFRVFSFCGLGVSLLALSWFYSRFVFRDAAPADDQKN